MEACRAVNEQSAYFLVFIPLVISLSISHAKFSSSLEMFESDSNIVELVLEKTLILCVWRGGQLLLLLNEFVSEGTTNKNLACLV